MYLNLKQTLFNVVDVIFPLRADARIVKELTPIDLEKLIIHRQAGEVTTLFPFHNPFVRACIHEVKYHQNQTAIDLLGGVLRQYLLSKPKSFLIVPVPLSKERQKKRGYNQTTLITKAAVAQSPVKFDIEILERVKDTKPQTSLSKTDRQSNVKNAFAIYDTPRVRNKIANSHIILFDDVTTTGATLQAAKAALLTHQPASITLLALAH